MAIDIYNCNSCDFSDEFYTSKSVPKSLQLPEDNICPECKKGKLIREDGPERYKGIDIDVIGGYDYEYGKKAWKKNLSTSEQADVLLGDKDPY